MRLAELDPRWVGINPANWSESARPIHLGLTFLCPHCKQTRLGVFFKPFIDPDNFSWKVQWALPGAPNPNTGIAPEVFFWNRAAGETFETITLAPSINTEVTGHWHGFIENGETKP